jgi:hypothetical protein
VRSGTRSSGPSDIRDFSKCVANPT